MKPVGKVYEGVHKDILKRGMKTSIKQKRTIHFDKKER